MLWVFACVVVLKIQVRREHVNAVVNSVKSGQHSENGKEGPNNFGDIRDEENYS